MAAFVGTGSAHSASIYTLSPKMRDDAQCMYAVLRKVHGIDQVKLGAFESQGWVYPYLEYRAAPAPDGYRLIVRYEAGQSCTNVADEDGTEDFQCVPHRGAYGFTAALSGLYAEGTEPYDGGTPTIEKRWRAECRVDAGTLFI
jgi:hypothetical protein